MYLDRRHYNENHTEKVKYVDEQKALIGIKMLYRKRIITKLYNAYQCPVCGFWHIGHKYQTLNENTMTREQLQQAIAIMKQIDFLNDKITKLSDIKDNDPKDKTIVKMTGYGDFIVNDTIFKSVSAIILDYYNSVVNELEEELKQL